MHGYAKSYVANLSRDELEISRETAKLLRLLSNIELAKAVRLGTVFEVERMKEKEDGSVREISRTSKSDVMRSMHETIADLAKAGLVNKQTMRKFDVACLTPVALMRADDIRRLREREEMSQAVFAHILNVSVSVVSQWERGKKHPAGAALKLLSLLQVKGIDAIT